MIVLNLVLALFLSFINPTEMKSVSPAKKSPITQAECDAKPYKDKCVASLPDGYTFLKSYTIDGQNGTRKKVMYSYIFSKNTAYLVMLANGSAQTKGVKVTLKDSNRKQLASSFANGKFYPALAYKCNATGIYFLEFEFDGATSFCAGSVLAFKR
ncbi:MAG: hypothetical protein NW226_15810 [Microscillaceae bacterium]|nr:hypothetical protein [Microscillaceae bacterium]